MKQEYVYTRASILARIITALSFLGALAMVALRTWFMPAQRDIDTGLFANNIPVIIMSLLLLVLFGFFAYSLRYGVRQEIVGRPSLLLSVVLMAVGAGVALNCAAELMGHLGLLEYGVNYAAATPTPLSNGMLWAQSLCGLLGGVALVRLGWMLASEGATRRGMGQWSMLAPVLWVWLTLANYMMSYASMVRVSDGFFILMMYVSEMIFLFIFARYIAGVGRVSNGFLLFCSCTATLFALSTPVVRMVMYLMEDSEAYAAAGQAGIVDLAIGVLALAVGVTMSQSLSIPPAEEEDEEEEEVVWSSEVDANVELIESYEDEEE